MMSSTARAIVYILCIGGLLACNALVVMVLWNQVLTSVITTDRALTFLEGAGITAFAYIGVFGARHALQVRRKAAPIEVKITSEQQVDSTMAPDYDVVTAGTSPAMHSACAQLSPDEKARLRETLAQQCGCTDRRTRDQRD
ncbi:MAG: hypothetical protein FGM24_01910 [Candidatus Kapabacteria bacterium]|nr:hypothetical protein [Candidatus Kapabacteria bacterium]